MAREINVGKKVELLLSGKKKKVMKDTHLMVDKDIYDACVQERIFVPWRDRTYPALNFREWIEEQMLTALKNNVLKKKRGKHEEGADWL